MLQELFGDTKRLAPSAPNDSIRAVVVATALFLAREMLLHVLFRCSYWRAVGCGTFLRLSKSLDQPGPSRLDAFKLNNLD